MNKEKHLKTPTKYLDYINPTKYFEYDVLNKDMYFINDKLINDKICRLRTKLWLQEPYVLSRACLKKLISGHMDRSILI